VALMLSEVRAIVREVASETGVPAALIISPSRAARAVFARDEVIRRLRATGRSLLSIGRLVGRDHTTVCHALQKPLRKMPWHKPYCRILRGRRLRQCEERIAIMLREEGML
jgi:chromosomal replication initiation ATPase DnaA